MNGGAMNYYLGLFGSGGSSSEASGKRYVLTDGVKTNDANASNNIITGSGTNTLTFNGATNAAYGKFTGEIEELISTNITKLATRIPVFNASNPTLSTTINIATVGIGDYILAINPYSTNGDGIFAIPLANFTDAVNNVATSITSGKIGFQLNPVVGYRHNGTALEQYDFINMGFVNWNGSVFSNVINYAFNGFVDSGWFATTTNTQNTRNHNIGSSNINVIGYGSGSILGTNSGIVADYYAAGEARGTMIGGFTNTTLAIRIGGNTNQVFNDGTDVVLGSFFKFIATRNY